MAVTVDEAKILALRIASATGGPPIAIVDENTIERSFGWVFHYQSQAYLESRNIMYRLGGNGPIFVNRDTGRVSFGAGGIKTQLLIEAYEALGPDRFDAG
jgi:hypothetical protein